MMPVAAYNLLQSITLLAAAARNFAKQSVEGLTATEQGPALLERGLAMGTALAPRIGYDAAAAIAKEAAETGRTIREVARQRAGLSESELDRLLDPASMVEPSASQAGRAGGG
jgi:fumarate hydratase class II